MKKRYVVDSDNRLRWNWNVRINGRTYARCETQAMAQKIEDALKLVEELLADDLPLSDVRNLLKERERIREGLTTIRYYTGPQGHPNGKWDAHVIAGRLLEGQDQNGREPNR